MVMILTLIVAVACAVLIAACWVAVRGWFLRWGATEDEATGSVVGDDNVSSPDYRTTLAVTIDASSGEVWPWLVQMGYQRGGLYSYDWLHRLFGFPDRPSAPRILPQVQHLRTGQRRV